MKVNLQVQLYLLASDATSTTYCNMFYESHGFVAVPVISSNNLVSLHEFDRDKLEHVSLMQLVTSISIKP